MVLSSSRSHSPQPWAAYTIAAIVLHGLAIALIVTGDGGQGGEPIAIELVDGASLDQTDPFAAPPISSTAADPSVTDPNVTDRTLPDESSPAPIDPESIESDPVNPQPIPTEVAPSDPISPDPVPSESAQPNPAPTDPVPDESTLNNSDSPNNPETPRPQSPAANSPLPAPVNPAEPNSEGTGSSLLSPAPSQNPADIPKGEVPVSGQSQGISLDAGLASVAHPSWDIPSGRRVMPKDRNRQFLADPSQFACTSKITPDSGRDFGKPVTLDLAIDATGQVSDIRVRSSEPLSDDYQELARCVIAQWAFDPALEATAQGPIPRADNATVILILQGGAIAP